MFKDYYAILEIDIYASNYEVKNAFKRQAIKWHPDKNVGIDTTLEMQNVNEAYIILKDQEARSRYDVEYKRYYRFKEERNTTNRNSESNSKQEKSYNDIEFDLEDDILKKWMTNAQKQAFELAKKSLSDLIGMTSSGILAGLKASGQFLMFQIGCLAVIVLVFIIISIIKLI